MRNTMIKKLLLNQGKYETIEGIPPLTLEKSLGKDLRDYKVYGNSFQDGTPTPDTPVEVESVGEKTKNLFDIGTINDYIYYGSSYIKIEDNSLSLQHLSSSINYCYKKDIHYPSGSYAYSYDTVSGAEIQVLIRCYDNNGNTLTNSEVSIKGGEYVDYYKGWIKTWDLNKIVVPDNVAYWIIGFRTKGTVDVWNTITNIQVEYGDTATPYEPYGKYKIPVVSQGKNLFNLEPMLLSSNWRTDSSLSVGGYWNYPITGLLPNTEYTLSMKENGWSGTTNNGLYVALRNNVGIFVEEGGLCHNNGAWYYCKSKVTITSNENGVLYLSFYNPTDERLALFFSKCPDIILELGNTATDFEPYAEPIETNIYLDEPLRKIGEYADYVDFENGVVVRSVKESIFNGTENWKKNQYGTNSYHLTDDTLFATAIIENMKLVDCTHFKGIAYADRVTAGNNIVFIDYVYRSITIRNTEYADITSFIDFLKSNEVKANAVLSTPTETQIELPKLPTLKGTTVLDTKTNLALSNMSVVYKRR